MSLIERAVTRLGGGDPDPNQEKSDGRVRDHGQATKPSTIEDYVQRASQAAPEGESTSPSGRSDAAESGRTESTRALASAASASRAKVHVQTEPLRARGFVMPTGEQAHIAQEFRVIKRPLIANAFGTGIAPVKNGKRVMVTSAFPGEGKSFVAINLALSIAAERDHKVLLVDADVARPTIPKELGFEAHSGLMDWLIDANVDVAELVMQTDVEKLAILPAGRQHAQATEFLASASMNRLLDQISARFPDRIVIFDSAPLLVTTETRVLAQYMGQVVMVVEAGSTPKAAVLEALATIEGTAEVVGMVLNKTQGSGVGGYGYGYGGYGYGYGYGRDAKGV